jgi:hypothetical protein
MKQKFLVILYEMRRRYSLPFNWMFKRSLKIHSGMCSCVMYIEYENQYTLNPEEYRIFWTIMREEAERVGVADNYNYRYYWWPQGALKPRLKTIKAAIKRIENSNI